MEDLFHSQFENYTVDPSPGLWGKIQARILLKQFFLFRLNQFNVYYLAAALALLTGGLIMVLSPSPDPVSVPAEASLEEISNPAIPGEDRASSTRESGEGSLPSPGKSPAGSQEPLEDSESAHRDIESSETVPLSELPELESPDIQQTELESNDIPVPAKEEVPAGKIAFTANHISGCAPLSVKFDNASENAEAYSWTFGDGGSSSEENPSYVFDESGEFTVILRMTGKDGLEYMQQQTIRVFERPRALFELDENVSLGEPVYFYNYSKSAQFYEWDFGDQQKSTLSDPFHYYTETGTYNVKLKVWNENQCFDSLIIYNAFTSGQNDIRFPNAFTPNLSGPSGGYYIGNEIGNTIFHPVVEGELVEYKLQIYSRMGVLVFESLDLQTGWDGYYQEELAPQGVYVWKVQGRFSNGKTFEQSGDVTLIRRY
jgi:PKD repeat protein